MRLFCVLVLTATVVAGCGWGTYDRRERYLEAKAIPRVKIPDHLDQPSFEDELEIPAVADPRNISGQKLVVGLPEPLSTSFGVDQIVIKKLGDVRWVFIDAPPATVWPRVRQFWTDNQLELERVDPSRGEMESRWFPGHGATPEEIFESLKGTAEVPGDVATARHKFQVRIEPGIRQGSSEIHVEEKSLPLDGPVRTDVAWTGTSDDTELEGVVLSNLAFYVGERINSTTTVSRLASNIGGEKAELTPDRLKPVLTYKLPFNRAWATVADALDNARISVEDLDRDAANFYVYYDGGDGKAPSLFRRLLPGGSSKEEGEANRYVVHLDTRGEEVQVTVLKGSTELADALLAEKLLRIIKQYST